MNNKRSARRHPSGYSLVELLTTVAVAGTVAAFGVPALDALIKDHRRTAVVNALVSTVHAARAEVMQRGQSVVVCGFVDANRNRRLDPDERACAGRNWSDGWFAAVWRDENGNQAVDPGELPPVPFAAFVNEHPVSVRATAFTTAPSPAGTTILRPFGAINGNGTVTVCDARGAVQARALIISHVGRPRVSRVRPDGSPLACP